ncbi:hypothetical protein ABLV92_09210 [Staphylococcus equorum]
MIYSYTEYLQIEKIENKYLKKYYHFLKYCLDEILNGFETKNKIYDDWINEWEKNLEENAKKGISDFAVGAERIIYALLNGKGIGQPNSSPVGSDLFFEVKDAFIHIDLKTVQIKNIGDYTGNIFVGNNQNSYRTNVKVKDKYYPYEEASLPYYYNVKNEEEKTIVKKPCLTFFITILYEAESLGILNINLINMPNGKLEEVYGGGIIQAGKAKFPLNHPKRDTHCHTIRYKWSNCDQYELLNGEKRFKSIYYNDNLIKQLYDEGKISKKTRKN